VSVLLIAVALVAIGGALIAVTARDARRALGGLVIVLAVTPFLADPLPDLAPLAARIVAALLGGYLLFIVLRETTALTRGSLIGLPAEAFAAVAAFIIGLGTSGLGSTALGPAEAQGAGFALAVLAVAPIVRGSDVFRLGVALAILVTGAELVRAGLAGTPSALEQLMVAGLTVGLLGSVAVLCANAVTATGRLTLDETPERGPLFEAHPVPASEVGRSPHSAVQRLDQRLAHPTRTRRPKGKDQADR
jgi:hypothetical protein